VAAKAVSAPGGRLETVDAVQAGHAFEGPALEIGALLVDGTNQPDVPGREIVRGLFGAARRKR
jgi:hypothetical protein